jgi:hypothetical protein
MVVVTVMVIAEVVEVVIWGDDFGDGDGDSRGSGMQHVCGNVM